MEDVGVPVQQCRCDYLWLLWPYVLDSSFLHWTRWLRDVEIIVFRTSNEVLGDWFKWDEDMEKMSWTCTSDAK